MEIINLLETAIKSPWMLLFLGTWALGAYLKKNPEFPDKWIPRVLLLWGIVLGLALIQFSLAGGIVGAVMALFQMGLYDVALKPLIGGE